MDKRSSYYVFFSPTAVEKDKYQILLNGKETGSMVTKHDIMEILSASQFMDFVKEIGIYEVNKSVIAPYLDKNRTITDPRDRWQPK